MNSKLGKIWKEAIMALFWNLPGNFEENHEKLQS
jgi:hypothetical protein